MLSSGAVIAWGLPRLRDLPWRSTRDPWHILVSEVMLQQTQVSRVVPKWQAFVTAYPTPASCARSPLGDVLRLWHGLGYPRRARNLHEAAVMVVDHHCGEVPTDLDELLALPGIGDYTARAVRAFAFGCDDAAVDTNIARIHARVAGTQLTRRQVQAAAAAAVPPGEGWTWNQVLMDLGAVLCRPISPDCDRCPARSGCAWARAGRPLPDPAVGSAGVSRRQAPFEGSDRQARGRLLAALTLGPIDPRRAPEAMGRAPRHARRLIDALVAEGLVVVNDDVLRLP